MALPTLLGKKSATGSFNIFLGVVAQNVILAIGAIIVGRLLGSANYGLYTLSSVPANFVGLFAGLGIRNATIRFAAKHNHLQQQKELKETIITGIVFTTLVGLFLSILCFYFSSLIANMFGRSGLSPLIQLMSLTILTNALIIAIQATFIGLERTGLYSILITLRATLQACLGPLLILVIWPAADFGPLGGLVGHTVTSFGICAVGLVMSYFLVIKKLHFEVDMLGILKRFKIMLSYGIPLYMSRVMGGFLTQFLSMLMAVYVSDTLIGNYKVSMNFTVLISFFAIPISTILFPAFSKLSFRDDPETLRKIFKTSVKYTSFLIVPATILVVVLSQPLVSTLYGATFNTAPFFLSLAAWVFIFAGFGQFSIIGVLNGQGETRKYLILGLTNVAVGLPLAIVIVPSLQIVGVITTTIVSSFPQVALGLVWVRKLYGVSIDWSAIVKIFILSLVSGFLSYVSFQYGFFPTWLQLVIGTLVFTSIFIALAPIFGAIDPDDIQNLNSIFSESGFASVLLSIPLRIMLKLYRRTHTRKL